MVRQVRRLALGLLLGALVGWLWLRRQRPAEWLAPHQGGMGEPAASYPEYPASGRAGGGLSSQPDERIVLPSWTPEPSRAEDSPVAGRIVLPEGMESAAPAASGGEDNLGERLGVAGNGAEPAASLAAGSETTTEAAAPTGNGEMTPLVTGSEDDAAVEAAEPTGATIEGYCVRCKEQRPMVNVHPYTTANKRPALKGECAVCGAGMFKFTKE